MQSGFVKKRGDTWTAYYYTGAGAGRHQRSKGGFRTKREAQTHLNAVLGAMHTGDFVEPTRVTLGDYMTKRWLPNMEINLRPSTFDSYQRITRLHILPALGDIVLQALTTDDLDRFYRNLLKKGRKSRTRVGAALSPKTVRYVHTTLHKALRDAERKQLVTRNVADAADPPKLRQAGEREMCTWTPDEVRTFLEVMLEHRLGVAFVVGVTTGMRRGEILGLRWHDVDFTNRRLAVRQTVLTVNYQVILGIPKTKQSRRSIALDKTTVALLQTHHETQAAERALLGTSYHDSDLVFPREDGSPTHPDYFSQLFERTVARLRLPRIRLHDLRHTHATLGLAAGVAPKVISDRLGHSTVAFTQDVYMHAIPALEEQAAEQIASLIFPKPITES